MRSDPDLRRDPAVWARRIRPRTRVLRMVRRVRRHAPHLLLAATAGGLSYLLAGLAFGYEHAVFAPIASVVAVGLSTGQQLVRAIEISAGVVLGLLAADLMTRLIGAGAWQMVIAVLLAMSAAVALRASGLMANQAAVAAVFVMVLMPLQDTAPLVRLGDALIGGTIAVVLTGLFSPDPQRVAMTTAQQFLDRLATAYGRLSRALDASSEERAEKTLAELEQLETAGRDLDTAIRATRERIRLARSSTRLAHRRRLRAVEQVAGRAGLMLTSARSLSRAVGTLVRHGHRPDPQLTGAVEQLGEAVRVLGAWVGGRAERDAVQEAALRAATEASSALGPGTAPAAHAVAWQVRPAVLDLLRVIGLSQAAAVEALEDRAGRADRPLRTAEDPRPRVAEDPPGGL